MYQLTEELRQQVFNCIAGAIHPNATFGNVNELMAALQSLKPVETEKDDKNTTSNKR